MAVFRCKASGNTVEFLDEYDIKQMRLQVNDYEEVVEEEVKEKTTKKSKPKDK
jgi:hypothetical protein